MPLESFFAAHPRVAVAFSGGVDSAYLLYAAKTAGCDAAAYFLKTPFQPRFELEDAQKLAGQLGVPLHIVEYDVLRVPGVAENGPLRCYHCKRALFTRLWEAARADGFEVLCDGTNASDDGVDRPGMKALVELGVRSPLREAGLSSRRSRRLSREAGLFTHDKPAYACLATRVPTGHADHPRPAGKDRTRRKRPLLPRVHRFSGAFFLRRGAHPAPGGAAFSRSFGAAVDFGRAIPRF